VPVLAIQRSLDSQAPRLLWIESRPHIDFGHILLASEVDHEPGLASFPPHRLPARGRVVVDGERSVDWIVAGRSGYDGDLGASAGWRLDVGVEKKSLDQALAVSGAGELQSPFEGCGTRRIVKQKGRALGTVDEIQILSDPIVKGMRENDTLRR